MSDRTHRILPVLAFIMHAVIAWGQAPGYMGKKWVVSYAFNTNFNLLDPFHEAVILSNPNTPEEYSPDYFNMVHELSIDYCLNTRWTAGLGFRSFRTNYNNELPVAEYSVRPNSYYLIRGQSFVLGFKVFGEKFVAPWGRYFTFGPVFNRVNCSYDPYMHVRKTLEDHDTLYTDFGFSDQVFNSFDLMLGFGRSRVIRRAIVVEYGMNFHLLAFFRTAGGAMRESSPVRRETYIEETQYQRVAPVNAFNLFLRIGYLF